MSTSHSPQLLFFPTGKKSPTRHMSGSNEKCKVTLYLTIDQPIPCTDTFLVFFSPQKLNKCPNCSGHLSLRGRQMHKSSHNHLVTIMLREPHHHLTYSYNQKNHMYIAKANLKNKPDEKSNASLQLFYWWF